QGQEARLERKWTAARDAFRRCADESCPALVREACGPWLAEATEKIPSLVLRLSDATDGLAIPEPKAFVDGKPLRAEVVAGAPLELEPGRHVVRVEGTGYFPREEELTLQEGDRERALSIALRPLPLMPPLPEDRPAPPAHAAPFRIIGLSTAAAGLVAFGVGSVIYATGRAAIPAGCDRDAHVCDSFASTVDAESARSRANIGAGLLFGGLVALAAGSALFVVSWVTGKPHEGRKNAALMRGFRW
ncbi:MAG: hypothetical protein HOO96_14120, partial [Polyangiaceae bacterium]|nr:hypothetical protein [Polyangiaceae bacterium]